MTKAQYVSRFLQRVMAALRDQYRHTLIAIMQKRFQKTLFLNTLKVIIGREGVVARYPKGGDVAIVPPEQNAPSECLALCSHC